jgi:hypothetical protein
MRITKKIQKTEEILDEVYCDICGANCLNHLIDNDPDDPKEFVGIHIKQAWGYLSNKDLECWEADICEKCVDEKLAPLINFKKESYIRGKLF